MKTRSSLRRAVVAVALLSVVPCLAFAQHEAHHPPAGGPAAAAPSPGTNATAPAPAPPGGGMGGDQMEPPAAAPGGATAAMPPAPSPTQPGPPGGPPAGVGGMGGPGGMGAMMREMMTPKPLPKTPLYSTLMTLPALTPEKRAEIDTLASQQISEGMSQLATGSEALNLATQARDDAAMQHSVLMMRDGLNELEAGIAARRVLSEGKAPRNLALDWFKREMSLTSPVVADEPRSPLGLSPVHLFTMALLILFTFAMLGLYFAKMRRAAALFGRLEPNASSPPPGSAPPLVGAAGPAATAGGKPLA